MSEKIARIEAIVGRKVKRDISQMTEWAKGNLARAAESIAGTPNAHVGIVTGDRKSTRLNSSHKTVSRMPSSA